MEPALALRNLSRHKPTAQEIAQADGLVWEESADGLLVYLRKTIATRKDGTIEFLARLDCSPYDAEPPSMQFCDPQNPAEIGRKWWVHTTHPSENVIIGTDSLGQTIVGNCVVGFAEYYIFHKTAVRNPADWVLGRLVSHVGNLLDPRYAVGRGV